MCHGGEDEEVKYRDAFLRSLDGMWGKEKKMDLDTAEGQMAAVKSGRMSIQDIRDHMERRKIELGLNVINYSGAANVRSSVSFRKRRRDEEGSTIYGQLFSGDVFDDLSISHSDGFSGFDGGESGGAGASGSFDSGSSDSGSSGE